VSWEFQEPQVAHGVQVERLTDDGVAAICTSLRLVRRLSLVKAPRLTDASCRHLAMLPALVDLSISDCQEVNPGARAAAGHRWRDLSGHEFSAHQATPEKEHPKNSWSRVKRRKSIHQIPIWNGFCREDFAKLFNELEMDVGVPRTVKVVLPLVVLYT
jgi:hypothetical protein